jgi:hypothetical protein
VCTKHPPVDLQESSQNVSNSATKKGRIRHFFFNMVFLVNKINDPISNYMKKDVLPIDRMIPIMLGFPVCIAVFVTN